MKIIDEKLLSRLGSEAKESPRLRKNFNLHQSYEEPCQRLLNAIAPGSYIRPHRHLVPSKPEAFIALRGRMAALLFDDGGAVEKVVVIAPGSDQVGVDIPAGTWHCIVALEDSVFFEVKPGPYEPISDEDWAPWAPEEGAPRAGAYLAELVGEARGRE